MLLKKFKSLLGIKTFKKNIFRIQANNSIMCRYFCIGFIDFMFAGKTLIDYTILFSPYNFEKNDNVTLSILKMNKYSTIEAIDTSNLSDQTKFRLNEIIEIEDVF